MPVSPFCPRGLCSGVRGAYAGARPLVAVDLDDSLGEGLGGFLRQIVPDATRNDPVCVSARKFAGVGTGVRVWGAIGVAFKGDRGDSNGRTFRQPPFQI